MSTGGNKNTSSLPVNLFYTTCLSFLGGVFVTTLAPMSLATILWLLLMALACALLYRRGVAEGVSRPWLMLGFVLVFFALGVLRVSLVTDTFGTSLLKDKVGETITITGEVAREPDRRVVTQQLYIGTETDNVLVSTDRYLPVAYGDRVTVKGVLREPEEFVTDLGRSFDYPGYLLAKGVEYQIPFAEVTVESAGGGNFVITKLLLLKQVLLSKIESYLPEPTAGLSEGLLLGVKQALGEDLEGAFRETGIIHIVVLSGYNIMLVVSFVMHALGYLLPLKPRIFTGLIAICLFALMVGLSATVVRASIMASILLLAQAFSRSYLILRGLLLAGVLMVVVNPLLLVYDIGFQLSFMATLGLILVAPLLEYWFNLPKWFKPVGKFFYATLATQIMVLPLLLYYMGELSVVAVAVNLLVLPVVPVAMLLTFALAVAGFFSSSLASLIAFPAYFSLLYIIEIAKWFADLPFASVTVPTFPFYGVVVAYLGLGLLLWRVLRLVPDFGQGDLGDKQEEVATAKNAELLAGWVIEEESEEGIITNKEKAGVDLRSTPANPSAKDTPIFFR